MNYAYDPLFFLLVIRVDQNVDPKPEPPLKSASRLQPKKGWLLLGNTVCN